MATSHGSKQVTEPSKSNGICTFWLGQKHFGLDVALASEVVTVDVVTGVPLSPPAVRGLINLRGTPVPLLELGRVLGLDDAARASDSAHTALVLRHDDLLVGFLIDRMEAVVSEGRGTFTGPGAEEHPAVMGFLELDVEKDRVVTVLAPAVLLERLDAVRFVKTED